MKEVTYTEARRNLKQLIDQVVTSSAATVITLENGKKVVMMSLSDYNGWTTTNHLLSTPENSGRLLQAVQDVKAGRVIKRDLIDEAQDE